MLGVTVHELKGVDSGKHSHAIKDMFTKKQDYYPKPKSLEKCKVRG
jgi:hypothetical protein